MTRKPTARKAPPSRMLDYIELWLIGQVHEAGLTQAAVARAIGVDKSTVSRHFDLEASYSRNGGPDEYVHKMAALLDCDPLDVWEGATALWREDPRGRAPAARRKRVALRRLARAQEG